MFGQILVEFLFRLTFGVAAAMALTPPRQVTSGFFRVHLWVLLGLQTLAALALYSAKPISGAARGRQSGPVLAGRRRRGGELRRRGHLAVRAAAGGQDCDRGSSPCCALAGCTLPRGRDCRQADCHATGRPRHRRAGCSGLVTTAMLLGHWYLNTPTMKLAPLQRLIVLLARGRRAADGRLRRRDVAGS